MAELYSVGKKPNKETMDEIIAGLEAMGNYISDSEIVRREYRNALMKEYEEFIEVHERLNNDETSSDTALKGTDQ